MYVQQCTRTSDSYDGDDIDGDGDDDDDDDGDHVCKYSVKPYKY